MQFLNKLLKLRAAIDDLLEEFDDETPAEEDRSLVMRSSRNRRSELNEILTLVPTNGAPTVRAGLKKRRPSQTKSAVMAREGRARRKAEGAETPKTPKTQTKHIGKLVMGYLKRSGKPVTAQQIYDAIETRIPRADRNTKKDAKGRKPWQARAYMVLYHRKQTGVVKMSDKGEWSLV
jgi:hypothetical protein